MAFRSHDRLAFPADERLSSCFARGIDPRRRSIAEHRRICSRGRSTDSRRVGDHHARNRWSLAIHNGWARRRVSVRRFGSRRVTVTPAATATSGLPETERFSRGCRCPEISSPIPDGEAINATSGRRLTAAVRPVKRPGAGLVTTAELGPDRDEQSIVSVCRRSPRTCGSGRRKDENEARVTKTTSRPLRAVAD